MPLYDYDCANCGRRFEVIHGVHADRTDRMPVLRRWAVKKAITAAAVHFKGSGWAKKERRAALAPSKSNASARAPMATTPRRRRRSPRQRRTDPVRPPPRRARATRPAAAPSPRGLPRPRSPARRRSRATRRRATDEHAIRGRLDHARRGTGDPGRRQRPLHRRDDRWLGRDGPAARALSWAAGATSGAARCGRSSPRHAACPPRRCSPRSSRTGGTEPPNDARAGIVDRILAHPLVTEVRNVLDTYGRAPGGLLANGLAFATLFASFPIALLVLGVAGLFVGYRRPRPNLPGRSRRCSRHWPASSTRRCRS